MPDSAPLRDTVAARMKEAMKAGEKLRVGALRLIMAALKEREIEARGAGKIVSRADELALLTKMVKSRQESAAIYAEAGRKELAEQENAEIAVINEFLPKQMDEAAVIAAAKAAIASTGAVEHQGHGQGRQRAESRSSRRDGLRQGERDREGAAFRLRRQPPHTFVCASDFNGLSALSRNFLRVSKRSFCGINSPDQFSFRAARKQASPF